MMIGRSILQAANSTRKPLDCRISAALITPMAMRAVHFSGRLRSPQLESWMRANRSRTLRSPEASSYSMRMSGAVAGRRIPRAISTPSLSPTFARPRSLMTIGTFRATRKTSLTSSPGIATTLARGAYPRISSGRCDPPLSALKRGCAATKSHSQDKNASNCRLFSSRLTLHRSASQRSLKIYWLAVRFARKSGCGESASNQIPPKSGPKASSRMPPMNSPLNQNAL